MRLFSIRNWKAIALSITIQKCKILETRRIAISRIYEAINEIPESAASRLFNDKCNLEMFI